MREICRRPPRAALWLALAALAGAAPPARASLCNLDPVPAATLLLPYFEVDLTPGSTDDVIVTINNAQSNAALVHVTFWTDWAQPTLDFDVYLTGYDVLTWRLRPAFVNGNLPITADLQSDPNNTISPSTQPGWEASFAQCINFFPFYVNPIIGPANLERLRDGHTGAPISSLGNRCLGSNRGDVVARGYLTFDSISRCDTSFPGDPGYFAAGGTGIANNSNTLWGDYVIHKAGQNDVEPLSLVHVEAGNLPAGTLYTFYGSLPSATGGIDQREPLGEIWGAANWSGDPTWLYVPGLATTELVVWRDPTASPPTAAQGFTCGVGPDWDPLPQNSVYCFDEEENLIESCRGESCFALATQRVASGAGGVDTPFAAGWCRFDLGLADEGQVSGDVDFPGGLAQSYLTTLLHYDTLSTVGLPAVLLRGACDAPATTFLENLVFVDGFESGDTQAWSQVIP